MKKILKKAGVISLLTFALLLISQVSVWAQAAITNEADTAMPGVKVVLFFLLLLVVIVAPAFKKSIHNKTL